MPGSPVSPTPLRAIVARFSYPISVAVMEAVLREHPFAFCSIISVGSEPQYFRGLPHEQQEWFTSSEIRGCHYAGVYWDRLMPLDASLIEKMRDTEVLFYDAVARLEWKRVIPYAVRKRWYLRHLQFWNDYLTTRRINLYLSAWIPHELPDIIVYGLCRLRSIPILYFHTSSMRDTSFAEHVLEASAAQIGERYEALLQEYAGVTDPEQIPLGEDFSGRYRVLISAGGDKPPVEGVRRPTEGQKVRALLREKPWQFLRYAVGYLSCDGIRRAGIAARIGKACRVRRAFYNAHAIEPAMDQQRFVYLPLHFQPEASTVPMGGAFADQVLLAQMLNALLPEDVLIYIKEHPRESAWVSRSSDDYRDLLALKKVRLIARSVDTFLLRERCGAVATVTGTAGFEALFRGKPVFLFGYRFYQYARGVFHIRTVEDCAQAVREVFERGVRPTLVQSRLYLKAMEETCIHGSLNPWHLKVTRLSDAEHIRANTEAILEELKMMEGAMTAVS